MKAIDTSSLIALEDLQECPICHRISRSNRPTRDDFKCVCCGFSGPADTVAARNIAARVSVNMPIVASFLRDTQSQAPSFGAK
ncbi:MAG: zinc ribbon domain-containing protein [Methanotrichaceae archaeon]